MSLDTDSPWWTVANRPALAGAALACAAVPFWLRARYYTHHIEPQIRNAQVVSISDLRSILDSPPPSSKDYANQPKSGKLVFVRGYVRPKKGNVLISSTNRESVMIRKNEATYYSDDPSDLYLSKSELCQRARHLRPHKEISFLEVTFVLSGGPQFSGSSYVVVNTDGSKKMVPYTTVYCGFEHVDKRPYINSINAKKRIPVTFPIIKYVEERILEVGKCVSAIGICRYRDGFPEISCSKDIPYFLTDSTSKDELLEVTTKDSVPLLYVSSFLGLLSFGFFSYSAIRKWSACSEWGQLGRLRKSA